MTRSLLLCALLTACARSTPLDGYVARADDSFALGPARALADNAAVYELTSQTWRGIPWRHWLTVIRPPDAAPDTALLVIAGGEIGKPAPEAPAAWQVDIARASGIVVAELRMVPNQPLDLEGPLSEDALIAYTWDQYHRTGDPTWAAQLPMTQSAVRAMDAVGRLTGVRRFIVTGASKRGWTAWLAAAVDPRVVGVVPIVIDVLNVEASMRHHHAAYGFWAPAIHDYEERGLMEKMDAPEQRALLAFVDPFAYRERYTMPKLMINAAGDQFFLPDSSRFYFEALPGPKYLRTIPNADHSLKDTDARASLAAFVGAVTAGRPLPRVSWMVSDGVLRVEGDPPDSALLWQATNPAARDFRLETIGKVWTSRPLTHEALAGVPLPAPERGWTASFVELTFGPHTFTTAVTVSPDTLPHAGKR